MKSSEGIKKLQVALKQFRPEFLPKHIPIDLADLRQVVPDDEKFGNAVNALADAIELIHRKRERAGRPLLHDLGTWYRYSFESKDGIDLRVIYKPHTDASLKLLGFGHRHFPHSVYLKMTDRLKWSK